MTDDADLSLHELHDRLRFILQRPIDISKTDPETTEAVVRLLSAAATYFNILAVSDFGGRGGPVRAVGMVEQVVAAAFQTFAGQDPHPEPFEKAAMLLRGIIQGHPFNDGNKRTGFLTAAYYLDLMGYPYPPALPEPDVIAFCLRVSAGELRAVEDIRAELERFWINR